MHILKLTPVDFKGSGIKKNLVSSPGFKVIYNYKSAVIYRLCKYFI